MDQETTDVLNKIAKVLEAHPEVLAAYLYGSRQKGYARPDSDYDIAVMLKPGFTGNSYHYQFDLEDDVREKLTGVKTEVILLDNMNYPLRYNSSVKGYLFYSRDDELRTQEQIKIMNIREDFGDFFDLRLRYNIEAAKDRVYARSGNNRQQNS